MKQHALLHFLLHRSWMINFLRRFIREGTYLFFTKGELSSRASSSETHTQPGRDQTPCRPRAPKSQASLRSLRLRYLISCF